MLAHLCRQNMTQLKSKGSLVWDRQSIHKCQSLGWNDADQSGPQDSQKFRKCDLVEAHSSIELKVFATDRYKMRFIVNLIPTCFYL